MSTYYSKSEKYKVEVEYDTNSECPATEWDMSARHYMETLKGYEFGNVKQDLGEKNHRSLLQRIAIKYAENKDIIKFAKKNKIISYNRQKNKWEIGCITTNENLENYKYEIIEMMDDEDIIKMLEKCPDLVFNASSSNGYSQGDHYDIYSITTKERFKKMVDKKIPKNWKEKALKLIEKEQETIELWVWGDVKQFTLYKKVEYTKVFKDSRKNEPAFDWEEKQCICDIYMEEEEDVAKMALEEIGEELE